jgi:hypothetical protein
MLKVSRSSRSPRSILVRMIRLPLRQKDGFRAVSVTAICVATAAAALAVSASALAARSELTALTEQGISTTRAEEALDLQGRVARANLATKVEQALGDAFAGVWFTPETARFYIGVASQASARTARRLVAEAGLSDVAVVTPVRSTWAALVKAQSEWGARLALLVARQQASTGLVPQYNAVSVTLSSAVPARERAALSRAAASEGVNVRVSVVAPAQLREEPAARRTCEEPFTTLKAFCEEAITAGAGTTVEQAEPQLCTAGPLLISGDETYMLTAGHCFGPKNALAGGTAFNNVEVRSEFPGVAGLKEIGKEGVWYYYEERDMAEVKVTPRGPFTEALPIPVPALMAEWGARAPRTPHAVNGEETNIVGQANCHEGLRSAEQCGTITELNIEAGGVKHLVKDTACGERGDSGGPYFMRERTTNNVLIQGMLVTAAITRTCAEGERGSSYEPLRDLAGAAGFGLLSTFPRQRLLTTATENRRRNEEEQEKEEKEEEEKVSPTLLFLGGEAPTVLINNKAEEAVSFELQSSVAKITGRKLTLQETLLAEKGAVAGIYSAKFFETEHSGSKCETTGAAKAGEIEVGERGKSEKIEVVYIKIGSPLEVGEVFNIGRLEVTCGAVEITVSGSVLGSLAPLNKQISSGSNELEGGLACSRTSGTPAKTKYVSNRKGEAAETKLTVNSGGVRASGCELVGTSETATIRLLPNKMVELMG